MFKLLNVLLLTFSTLQMPAPYYEYRAGEGAEKGEFEENALLTLNVDMLKGGLHKKYGGITAPVPERAKRLGAYVKGQNVDLFLSQEIPLESAQFVYEALRDEFPHFWMGMGLIPGEKESGLFVASKYPILSEPRFFPFPEELQRPDDSRILERGFFAIETPKAWVITTHMDPKSPEVGGPYRRLQLAYITQEMDLISQGKPYLVAGDLNIERTGREGDEYSRSGIPDLFYDPYTEAHPQFDETTYTCTNLLTFRANGQEVPEEDEERNEIDDYVLVRKTYRDQIHLEVELLTNTYDLSQGTDEALTDHRAYKAKFSEVPPLHK